MTVNWKKTLLVTADTLLAIYLLFAVSAFNKPDTEEVCSQVNIDISDGTSTGFLDAEEIKKILQRKHLYPLGQKMTSVSTRAIEDALRQSPFVDDAQCFKTSGGHICVQLTQRTPIIRVKALNGEDYYVDNHGGIMPNTKYATDIIIATGNINHRYAQKVLTRIGNFISSDKFWQEQIVQINVLADGSIEIVPRVGDHIVYLGEPVYIQRKLARLEKFYKYGLNQAGWNKYSYINMEFDNQIICKKKPNNTEE